MKNPSHNHSVSKLKDQATSVTEAILSPLNNGMNVLARVEPYFLLKFAIFISTVNTFLNQTLKNYSKLIFRYFGA